jgi:Mor family transcriptional regulator
MADKPSLFLDESYPEVLADIARTVHEQLMEHPKLRLAHPIAAEVAMSVAESVRKNIGGVATYIPRGTGYDLSQRDREIWTDFKGDNYAELARKYDLTEMRIRQIVTHAAKVDRRARQENLFPTGTE